MQINSKFNNTQPNDSMFTYSVWVMWLNIAKFTVYLRYRYCSNLFRGMRRESEFWQHHCRNSTKVWEREKEKKWERENAWISVMWLPKFLLLNQAVCSKWDVLKKNQLWQYHCQNRGRKNKLWQLWQCITEIGEEKKIVVTQIWGGIKKISATSIIFLQYFHNKSHMISYY